MLERNALAQRRRADRHPKSLQNLPRLLRARTAWRDSIEHRKHRRPAGKAYKVDGRGDRLQIIDRWPAGDEHKIGGPSRRQCALLRPRRRVDQILSARRQI